MTGHNAMMHIFQRGNGSVGCFAMNVDREIKKQVMREIGKWHLKPAGRQCMTIFQIERIEKHPESILEASLAFVAKHVRFREETAGLHGKKTSAGIVVGGEVGTRRDVPDQAGAENL